MTTLFVWTIPLRLLPDRGLILTLLAIHPLNNGDKSSLVVL